MLLSLEQSSDPIVMAYLNIGVPSYDDCMSFYTGLESSFPEHMFCYNLLEVDGIKDFCSEHEQCYRESEANSRS